MLHKSISLNLPVSYTVADCECNQRRMMVWMCKFRLSGDAKAKDSSLTRPVIYFLIASFAAESQLWKMEAVARVTVIKELTVPRVRFRDTCLGNMWQGVSPPCGYDIYITTPTPPTHTTWDIFRRLAEISISAWMNLWTYHCVSHLGCLLIIASYQWFSAFFIEKEDFDSFCKHHWETWSNFLHSFVSSSQRSRLFEC